MAMTRKEFLASAASAGALSACAGKVIVLAAVAFLALAGNCGTRYWLPRANSLRAVTNGTDTSTLTLFSALTSSAAIQRDVSFLPSAKEKSPITHVVNRKVAMAEKLVAPYDEELEYLEANGNQYINTTVKSSNTNIILLDIGFNESYDSNTDYDLISTGTWAYRTDVYFINNTVGGVKFYTDNGNTITIQCGARYKILISGTTVIFYEGDVLYGMVTTTRTSNGKDILFLGLPTQKMFKGKIYSYAINNQKAIPVLKDGIPAMYREDGLFLYNQVSGHQFGYKKKDGTIVNPY